MSYVKEQSPIHPELQSDTLNPYSIGFDTAEAILEQMGIPHALAHRRINSLWFFLGRKRGGEVSVNGWCEFCKQHVASCRNSYGHRAQWRFSRQQLEDLKRLNLNPILHSPQSRSTFATVLNHLGDTP